MKRVNIHGFKIIKLGKLRIEFYYPNITKSKTGELLIGISYTWQFVWRKDCKGLGFSVFGFGGGLGYWR